MFLSKSWPDQHCNVGQPGEVRCVVKFLVVYEILVRLKQSNWNAGYNVCIFAYGQTGSGKTHTMSGTDVENLEGRGINYRALDDLFALRESRHAEVGSRADGGVQRTQFFPASLSEPVYEVLVGSRLLDLLTCGLNALASEEN